MSLHELHAQLDAFEKALGEDALDRRTIGQVGRDVRVPRQRLQPRQAGVLERGVVVVVEVVEADDLVAAGEEELGDVGADEAGCTSE